jgi:hypothetical protein
MKFLMGDPIVAVLYNPTWPAMFAEHGRVLRSALGQQAARIDHIGSTAVPGLAAKPIIDIQVSVRALEAGRKARTIAACMCAMPTYDRAETRALRFFPPTALPPLAIAYPPELFTIPHARRYLCGSYGQCRVICCTETTRYWRVFPMEPLLARAAERRATATQILTELRLLDQWACFGTPIVVGAVAYDLVVAPDIDIEIFCAAPAIPDGFVVLQTCAQHPRVRKARFANKLTGPDYGLYWQLRYQSDDGQIWKCDMWSLPHDHPGPVAAALVEPMKHALSEEIRLAILAIKEQALSDVSLQCGSINIYRAVIDDGIRTSDQFRTWIAHHQTSELLPWKPEL